MENGNPYASPHAIEYDPGIVKWWQFLYATVMALLLAAALGFVLHVLFHAGLYLVPWAPLVAAFLLASALFWSIQFGHCRSRWLAAAIAFAAANVMYWGQYQIDMVSRVGPQAIYRVDLLPQYVAWRKNHVEKQEDLSPSVPRRNAKEVTPGLNWFVCGMELCLVVAIAMSGAVVAAGRPYCNHCGQWMRRDGEFLPEGSSERLIEAVEKNSLGNLLGLEALNPMKVRRFTAVMVSWCPPRRGRASRCPAYLSIKKIRFGGGVGQINQIDLTFGRTRLRMRPLTTRQIADLRPRFLNMSYSAVGCDALPPEGQAS